ncbi:MAG: divergent polysaccharide deacetylase family protein [Candidatus Omnitrophica bacterium]|nr:divergent polysaccharide deacetylase family protein [Candidatus Omnitrophota bacterium]
MAKILRIFIFIVLIIIPIVFYSSLNKSGDHSKSLLDLGKDQPSLKPSIALIFDDLGGSLTELREIYSLDIPLTVSIIPNLKFSKNIAHIASRCGFSVFIHLPMEPKKSENYRTDQYRFISGSLSQRENKSLLRNYLNSIRIAIGVNNHMGSMATEDRELMSIFVQAVKNKGLIFVDSRTSLDSVAYEIAHRVGLPCGYNEGFLDAVNDLDHMQKQIDQLLKKAKEKGKIIIIAHPRAGTIEFLKQRVAALKEEVDFITIKEYFKP